MALDRLDAIIIGANVEGLFAALELARAGRHIAVLERQAGDAAAGAGRDAAVSVAAIRELNLTQHGLRLAPAPAIVGITSDRALILWPDALAAQASIALHSPRDADAYEYFRARVARASTTKPNNADLSLTSWLLSANTIDEAPTDHIVFRISPLAKLLDEIFDSQLLKGMLAHGALVGTAVSPNAPGSAVLLKRQTAFASDGSIRFVAGGEFELRRALLAALKFYNNADVQLGAEVHEIVAEREAVQSVRLLDNSVLRASVVISTLGRVRTTDLLADPQRYAGNLLPQHAIVEPAQVRFTVASPPKLPGIDAATVASGAIVRLNPSLERLIQAHGMYGAQQLTTEPCLELRVAPKKLPDGKQRWSVFASALYIPDATSEGSWTGNRRERLIAHCVKAIESLAPGFTASVEAAVLTHPKETQTVMDAKGRGPLVAHSQPYAAAVPDVGPSTAGHILKGLIAIDPSLFASAGEGGLLAALNSGLNKRTKVQTDA